MAEDKRTKVIHILTGRVGAIERIITKNYCTVQFQRGGYYEMCKLEDLEPVDEAEFKGKPM